MVHPVEDAQSSPSPASARSRHYRRVLLLLAVFAGAFLLAAAALFLFITHRVEGETFDSGGVLIHYTDEGEGEAVLLLHGFAVNSDLNWRRQGITQALSREYRVLGMDLRGHGLSGKPPEESAYGREMAEDVIRLLDHLGIRKAHIVGYSLGGFITLYLAAHHPDRVLTASVLGAGWEPPENSPFLKALDRLADALRSGDGIPPLSGELGEEREKPGLLHVAWVYLMTKYFNDPSALVGVIRGIPEFALTEEEVRGIDIPILAIAGDHDPLRVSADAMVGRVRDAREVILEGADHLQAPSRPELLEELLTFLRNHPDGIATGD